MMRESQNNLRKLSRLRTELEVVAARELARNFDLRQRAGKALGNLLESALKAARNGNYVRFQILDHQLHETMVRLAEVPLLIDLWSRVWATLAEFHQSSLEKYWPDLRALIEEHEYFVRAILSGDEVAAEDGVRSHLQAVWYRIAEKDGDSRNDGNPLERATAYLCFHFHRPVRLSHVARTVSFISEGHLSKLFYSRYGIGFQAYLQNLRLEKASKLLIRTDLLVSIVAKRCGYRDTSRFGQHFRRKFGSSPHRWRQSNHLKDKYEQFLCETPQG